MIVGRARSASVTARPQVGSAGQAIDQRRTVETCSTVAMPYSSRSASISPPPGRLEVDQEDRLLAGQPGRASGTRSKKARRPLARRRSPVVLDPAVLDRDAEEELAVALLVPAEVVVDLGDRASAWGRRSGWPRYSSTFARKAGRPQSWMTYLSRARLRSERLPKSRKTLITASPILSTSARST